MPIARFVWPVSKARRKAGQSKRPVPRDNERLTQRQQKEDKRRVYYDFTCSAPKSVSVLAVTLDDERLVTAHEEATHIAFRELEAFAATRARKQSSQKDRTTANLIGQGQ